MMEVVRFGAMILEKAICQQAQKVLLSPRLAALSPALYPAEVSPADFFDGCRGRQGPTTTGTVLLNTVAVMRRFSARAGLKLTA